MEYDPRPTPPVEPALEDCCTSGCTFCVFDVYQDALFRYRQELAAWQARHPEALTESAAPTPE